VRGFAEFGGGARLEEHVAVLGTAALGGAIETPASRAELGVQSHILFPHTEQRATSMLQLEEVALAGSIRGLWLTGAWRFGGSLEAAVHVLNAEARVQTGRVGTAIKLASSVAAGPEVRYAPALLSEHTGDVTRGAVEFRVSVRARSTLHAQYFQVEGQTLGGFSGVAGIAEFSVLFFVP
jgi:hypothetical protein